MYRDLYSFFLIKLSFGTYNLNFCLRIFFKKRVMTPPSMHSSWFNLLFTYFMFCNRIPQHQNHQNKIFLLFEIIFIY